ncbi:unnamed protein product [Hermetia illucens]|uniref:Uncharacterized protein n=1 Tax=Hermetia illucens TaxID=343691 RepID=A0A7R8YKT0_HERIL|nr:unnamed protein product [Hermetia illucens]
MRIFLFLGIVLFLSSQSWAETEEVSSTLPKEAPADLTLVDGQGHENEGDRVQRWLHRVKVVHVGKSVDSWGHGGGWGYGWGGWGGGGGGYIVKKWGR